MLSKTILASTALAAVVNAHGPPGPPGPPGYGPGHGNGGSNTTDTYPSYWEKLQGSNYLPSFDWYNANWPPQSVGAPLVPQKPDQELIDLVESVDINREHATFCV